MSVNEKHIDKVLEITEKSNEHKYKDSISNRRYNLVYLILGIIMLCFLIYTLKDNHSGLLLQILVVLTLIISGFGAGYGYCKMKNNMEGE